jgi:DnaJ-class molecular chaperone
LRTGLGVDEIKRLRRRFALENHPDRVPTELREEASIAMAEVNAEIDEALKRARKR